MRGRRGPGIVGTVARTAVIAGTATAVSNRVSDRHYNKAAEQQQAQMADQAALSNQQDMEPMQAQQLQGAVSPPDLTAKLKQLADLKAAGVLSDEEFSAAKAKLLT